MDLKYSNTILDYMILRCSDRELKNILLNSELIIRWHGMSGNYNDCSAFLLFTQKNYFTVKDKNFMDKYNDLLVDSIPLADYVQINSFSIGIIDEGISFEITKEDVEKDIYRLERLIKMNHSSYLVELFTAFSMKYSSIIDGWQDISERKLQRNDLVYDRENVKNHALKIMSWIKSYYRSINVSEPIKLKTKSDKYDVFISHANKDKLNYVNELKENIENLGLNIFYDKDVIEWGDKWKDVILNGIEKSRFAIIVISNNFFDREWTEKELKSFLERQNENNQKVILPILYNVEPMEVFAKYPDLSDIQFIKASDYDCKDIAIKFARELIKDLR